MIKILRNIIPLVIAFTAICNILQMREDVDFSQNFREEKVKNTLNNDDEKDKKMCFSVFADLGANFILSSSNYKTNSFVRTNLVKPLINFVDKSSLCNINRLYAQIKNSLLKIGSKKHIDGYYIYFLRKIII